MALAVVLLYWGGHFIDKGVTHKGPGWWNFSDYSDDGSGETGDKWLAENQYKRLCYRVGGMSLVFSGMIFWSVIAEWKKKNELETSWERMVSNPLNVQDIRLHPERYRDDFRQWIKENHPNLPLEAKGGTTRERESK